MACLAVRVVTGFVLTEREPKLRPVTSRVVGSNLCRESALVSRGLELSNGLRLGMSQAEVVTLLGPPTSTRGATLTYRRDDRASLPRRWHWLKGGRRIAAGRL